ncbi:MAG: PAS domain S-box protein [Betaproteobacteria bacterium]
MQAKTKMTSTASPWSWWTRWWNQQSPVRQDRFANLAPLAAVALFLAAIMISFWYLRNEEIRREQESIKRDVEYAQQRIRLRMLERQEQLTQLANSLAVTSIAKAQFKDKTQQLIDLNPELLSLTWIDANRRIMASQNTYSFMPSTIYLPGSSLDISEIDNYFSLVEEFQQPIYAMVRTRPNLQNSSPTLQLLTPIIDTKKRFHGVLLTEYALDRLLRNSVPTDILTSYAVSFQDENRRILAGQSIPEREDLAERLPFISRRPHSQSVTVPPVGNSLVLQMQVWRTSQGLVGSALFWLVGALSVMTSWMLIGNWRHTRRRLQAQNALMAETNFRRAMENSMLTGMRALDLKGCITYVNPAFCQMTGWAEAELVNAVAPFPYWPEEDIEQLTKRLEEEISGKHTAGGFQVRVKRKDGSRFDARMYVSPLIDPSGRQTGWMTSMTDITEPNRIRAQLAGSYERFTIVLEALDASVSVTPLGSKELLFANKLYRHWFAGDSSGHLRLVAQAGAYDNLVTSNDDADDMAGLPSDELTSAQSGNAEIYVAELDKWLEIRSRYINWADGRLAQMVIATDITQRRRAEALAAQQADRAQTASRLITMGEMAFSVAHELNQPLAAISNYCNGMISRIKRQQIEEKDLLGALEKTAHQAQRAGQVINRIRSFVKRSEPNRSMSDVSHIVSEALELAEIELRRRNVRLSHYIAARLPTLNVDPILIEQVLINLMKNSAEAIDNAQRPHDKRHVELRVVPRQVDEQQVIEFSVTDTGKGLPPEAIDKVYEAFFSTKAEGMGIGLNLCRSIVESHQGRIEAQNLYNAGEITGCRFSFWLPVTGTH